MATAAGFEIVNDSAAAPAEEGSSSCSTTKRIWCYSYENRVINSTSKIWLNSEGKVAFQSLGKTTAWHGSWQWDTENNMLDITFNHNGNEKRMKSVVLLKNWKKGKPDNIPEMYGGRDSCGRAITMTLLDFYEEDTEHNGWDIV